MDNSNFNSYGMLSTKQKCSNYVQFVSNTLVLFLYIITLLLFFPVQLEINILLCISTYDCITIVITKARKIYALLYISAYVCHSTTVQMQVREHFFSFQEIKLKGYDC